MYGRDEVFFFFLSYLTAFSVWNTDEEIKKREPTTGHDRQIRDLNRK